MSPVSANQCRESAVRTRPLSGISVGRTTSNVEMRSLATSSSAREPGIHIHLIGVCGTGMGAFAGLLKQAGHRVTGSDTAFYAPMGDALRNWGIETRTGFDAAHLEPPPDLVVVGEAEDGRQAAALSASLKPIT